MTDTDASPDVDLDSDYHRGYAVGYQAASNYNIPTLASGVVISIPSYVVDDKGVAWWIDPPNKSCWKVNP